MARTSKSLKLIDPEPDRITEPITLDVPGAPLNGMSMQDGALTIEHGDGSATIDFSPEFEEEEKSDDGFYANLALKMDQGKLDQIATDLLDGIERDELSRKEWLDTRARGIELLGLKLEDPRGDVGTSSAPLEGMSTVRHPLLLEATISFQATARGELLPAGGPAKIRNDTLQRPPLSAPPLPLPPGFPPGASTGMPGAPTLTPQQQLPNAGPGQIPPSPVGGPPPVPPGGGMLQPVAPPPTSPPVASSVEGAQAPPETKPPDSDYLADALEMDMNHYLTAIATEYVPDTDRMLFYIGFGGDGFKKVFNCPLRQRVVSESVDAEDLIVSNAATDLQNCGRITHRIKMRKSVLRRMQILKVYRDVEIPAPSYKTTDAVESKKEEISGHKTQYLEPKDLDYEIYESYCEIDLDEFAPKKFKGKGLPLPYRVTVAKESRQVLSVIRNWKRDDEEALSKQYFVQFPFVRGLGFYGLGFIHILGNTTNTLTAIWREMVDSGMFSNFPGFLYAKGLGRQLTNQFRVPPGGGIGLDVGAQMSIKDAVMPLPYKEAGPSWVAFSAHLEEVAQRLAQTAHIQIGEGKQDAPVGTTMALIEQATKMLDSAHKRLHAAQADEFKLIKERFREDPECFWKFNKKPSLAWEKKVFIQALENNDLVPVADPNNPTALHRIAKAATLQQLMQAFPLLLDPAAVLTRIMRIIGIDTEGLLRQQPAQPPPDPRMEAIQQKAQAHQMSVQQQAQAAMIKMHTDLANLEDKARDRASREKIEQMRLLLQELEIQKEAEIHGVELHRDNIMAGHEMAMDHAKHQQEMQMDMAKTAQDAELDRVSKIHGIQADALKARASMEKDNHVHAQKMAHERQMHELKRQHAEEMHQQKLEHARAMAQVAKSRPAKSS